MSEDVKHDTVLDTGAEQLGKTYAQALVAAAIGAGVADQVVDQLGRLVDEYVSASPKLAAAFSSPRIGVDEKLRVIDRVFGDEFHPVLIKFLKVMANRNRLGYVAAVRTAAESIHDDMMGRVLALVKTAVPLDEQLRGQIIGQLSQTMNKEVRLRESVEPNLIGGMVIRVGDTVFDNSVSNRLNKMARLTRDRFSAQLLDKFEQFTS
jgi:F-type H+-transporting ATPase subunit delta